MGDVQNKTFLTQFSRLLAEYKLEESRVAGKSREFFEVFKSVGQDRFTRATSRCIHESGLTFFPTVGQFKNFIPESDEVRPGRGMSDETFGQLGRERRANPDAFFGERDVKAMMQIAMDRNKRNLAPLSGDEMVDLLLELRHSGAEASRR